ncbi:tyrosine-protein kinase transmembrane receptor Ror-like isoform X2 [Aphis craccivora]|uniref:Tyrosine-protein kinase transmembrane receptor Ror-like isoform X2 n=1 Tax=Aphis craccivora TaxID=307492 RepID=A0A6G0YZI7_APHCR|nr:tyrosine-protein kinase transmembrane receptor Ror-like isoform X2 [Aphis craccivora]
MLLLVTAVFLSSDSQLWTPVTGSNTFIDENTNLSEDCKLFCLRRLGFRPCNKRRGIHRLLNTAITAVRKKAKHVSDLFFRDTSGQERRWTDLSVRWP